MTRMIPQLHTCILGLTGLVGFTLVGSHAAAVSPSDSSSAMHFSDQHWTGNSQALPGLPS
jgi:hypothetical protein